VPRKSTPGRIRKSTGAKKARQKRRAKPCDASDLRKDYSEKIGEVATELSWFWEKKNQLPPLIFGPRLDRRITHARKQTQAFIDEFGVHLVESCPNDFESEAKKAVPEFTGKSQTYIDAPTVDRWVRLAINRARRVAKKRPKPAKEIVARSRKSLLTVEQLAQALKPAALQVSEAAKALGCSPKTIYRMVERKDRTEKGNIKRDEKLRKVLVARYGEETVAKAWPQ